MLKKNALGIVLIILCSQLSAASFDCSKAGNAIEAMICSDSNVSGLDERLDSQYRKALAQSKNSKSLVQEQRKWIVEDRNKCRDVPCLTRSYTERMAKLKGDFDAGNSWCSITEEGILGGWQRAGSGDFEEMAFELYENKRSFSSRLHQRPEMVGTWTLKDCEIHIVHHDDPKLSFDYRITKYADSVLHLQEMGGGDHSAYKKIK